MERILTELRELKKTIQDIDERGKISLNDIINLNEAQAMARYNIGRHSLRRISDDIGAVVWVGRKRLYCREVMDRHFLSISE